MIVITEIKIIPRVYIDRNETVIYYAATGHTPYRASEVHHPSLADPFLNIWGWVKVFSYVHTRNTERSMI